MLCERPNESASRSETLSRRYRLRDVCAAFECLTDSRNQVSSHMFLNNVAGCARRECSSYKLMIFMNSQEHKIWFEDLTIEAEILPETR